jgi:hypothetical protein
VGAVFEQIEDRAFSRAVELRAKGNLAAAAAAFRQIRDLPQHLATPTRAGQSISGPDFIIIGAARSGTTWLKWVLKRHPDIFMPRGEPQYFAGALDRPARSYVADLAAAVTKRRERPIVGEKSPSYLAMADDRLELCAALFPHAKLICNVREPVGRVWSTVRHLGSSRPDPLAAEARFAGHTLDQLIGYGDYERHLRRWARFYPPEQFLIVEFEQIVRDPEAVYARTLDFVGARPVALPPFPANDPVAEPPEALRRYVETRCEGVVYDARRLMRAITLGAAEPRAF